MAMSSAGMKDAKRSWRPQFLHALLMRVNLRFKRIHSQASGFKSAVDFKWAEQFNRWDVQLQECPLFEDRLLLRGYKYKAAAVRGVWRGFFFCCFCFSVRFLCAVSEVNHHPRLFWLALNAHSSSVHLCYWAASLLIHTFRRHLVLTGRVVQRGAAAGWTHIHRRLSCACWFSRPQSGEQSPSVAFFQSYYSQRNTFQCCDSMALCYSCSYVCLFFYSVFTSFVCQALARKDLDFLLCRLWPYWEIMVFGFWCTWSPESGPIFFPPQSSVRNPSIVS